METASALSRPTYIVTSFTSAVIDYSLVADFDGPADDDEAVGAEAESGADALGAASLDELAKDLAPAVAMAEYERAAAREAKYVGEAKRDMLEGGVGYEEVRMMDERLTSPLTCLRRSHSLPRPRPNGFSDARKGGSGALQ